MAVTYLFQFLLDNSLPIFRHFTFLRVLGAVTLFAALFGAVAARSRPLMYVQLRVVKCWNRICYVYRFLIFGIQSLIALLISSIDFLGLCLDFLGFVVPPVAWLGDRSIKVINQFFYTHIPWSAKNDVKSGSLTFVIVFIAIGAVCWALSPWILLICTIITSTANLCNAFISASVKLYAFVLWLPRITAVCFLIFVTVRLRQLWNQRMAVESSACPITVPEEIVTWESTEVEELSVATPSLLSYEYSLDPWFSPTQCFFEQSIDFSTFTPSVFEQPTDSRTRSQSMPEQSMEPCLSFRSPSSSPPLSPKRRFSFGDQADVCRLRTTSRPRENSI
jgi:hypothetical protein